MATKTKARKSANSSSRTSQKKASNKRITEQKSASIQSSQKPSEDQDLMVRLLMTLSECEGETEKKGAVTKRLPRRSKSESTKTYTTAMGELEKAGALSEEKGILTLERKMMRDRLLSELTQPGFTFQSQLGKGKANVLLELIRELAIAPPTGNSGNGNGNGTGLATVLEPITSYDDFKTVALETFDQLKRDYNFDRLVPIYRIRREIGERVSRVQFSEWLFEMQAEDILELLEQSVEDGAPDKIEDSVTTSMGKLRCYAKRLDG